MFRHLHSVVQDRSVFTSDFRCSSIFLPSSKYTTEIVDLLGVTVLFFFAFGRNSFLARDLHTYSVIHATSDLLRWFYANPCNKCFWMERQRAATITPCAGVVFIRAGPFLSSGERFVWNLLKFLYTRESSFFCLRAQLFCCIVLCYSSVLMI